MRRARLAGGSVMVAARDDCDVSQAGRSCGKVAAIEWGPNGQVDSRLSGVRNYDGVNG
jgi:hypothetical protein